MSAVTSHSGRYAMPSPVASHAERDAGAFAEAFSRTSIVCASPTPPRRNVHRMTLPAAVTCTSASVMLASCSGRRGVPCLRSQRGAATTIRSVENSGWATKAVLSGGGRRSRIATSTPSPTIDELIFEADVDDEIWMLDEL